MINQTLNNRYKINKLLGMGGMGEVYLATDEKNNQQVAVKILARQLTANPDALERFKREGETLRQLDHPNIVKFIDAFEYESQYVIVMEYVSGGNLQNLIKKGVLPIEQARQITLDLCDALIRAHRLNIIHRDLKPENILITENGIPKLADFGVAKLSENTSLTRSGTQVGTPYYMSPEAWKGEKLDGQTDIWSLGVVLFEMLSGKVPFEGDTGHAVMTKVFSTQAPDLRKLRSEVPSALVKIVSHMLTRDKKRRYQSIRQVGVDLESRQQTKTKLDSLTIPRAFWFFIVGGVIIAGIFIATKLVPLSLPISNPTSANPINTQAEELDISTSTLPVIPINSSTTSLDELIIAAQEEGILNVIALPHDWCNYGEVIEAFKAKYDIEVNELDPNGGSSDEIEAIKANKDNKGPQAPDVIDIGLRFSSSAKEEGLIQPYKVATWDSIPAEAKDADGYWYGDYYGVVSFLVNTDVQPDIPQDWADLLDPKYNGQVALSGDPSTSSNQALQSVYAAALANSGSLDDAQAGLDYFAQMNSVGNLVPLIANNSLVATGEVAVRITWDYNALAAIDTFDGNPNATVVIPVTGRFAGVYVQAISAYAPHPNTAKLWMEFLYSDEGQLLWMEGYCHPIREADMRARGVIPQELLDKLPDVSSAVFPTLAQIDAAFLLIAENWDSIVGADIQAAP